MYGLWKKQAQIYAWVIYALEQLISIWSFVDQVQFHLELHLLKQLAIADAALQITQATHSSRRHSRLDIALCSQQLEAGTTSLLSTSQRYAYKRSHLQSNEMQIPTLLRRSILWLLGRQRNWVPTEEMVRWFSVRRDEQIGSISRWAGTLAILTFKTIATTDLISRECEFVFSWYCFLLCVISRRFAYC